MRSGLGEPLRREARYASDITRSALDLAATNAGLRLANAETERRLDQVMKSYEEYFTGLDGGVAARPEAAEGAARIAAGEAAAVRTEQFTDELSHKQKPTAKEQDLLARGRGHLGNILRDSGPGRRGPARV